MKNNALLLLIGIVAFFIAIGHLLGVHFSLYWGNHWFDTPMHFLGGSFVGLVALFFYRGLVSGYISARREFLVVLTAALAVGGTWEIFEIVEGTMYLSDPGYWLDTFHDLFFDVLGAVLARVVIGLLDSNRPRGQAPQAR